MTMRQRNEDFNYDYLTDEEYQALDWDASLALTCHAEDQQWSDLLSVWMYERGLVSTEDGFTLLPVDADLGFCMRAASVRELDDYAIEELGDTVRALPWERPTMVRLEMRRNDGVNVTACF